MPMLRFFRHGDGSFAHFNGVASSTGGLMATLISYDETLGAPASSAVYSAYERVQAGSGLLMVDVGGPPPLAYSSEAHAGTLAFELSHGTQRIVINCGSPAARHRRLRRAARRARGSRVQLAVAARRTSLHEQLLVRRGGPERFRRGRRHRAGPPHRCTVTARLEFEEDLEASAAMWINDGVNGFQDVKLPEIGFGKPFDP